MVRKNGFLLVSGGEEESCSLWIARILPLFIIGAKESSENQEYEFLQYIEVTTLIDIVDETLKCVCLRCCTNTERTAGYKKALKL